MNERLFTTLCPNLSQIRILWPRILPLYCVTIMHEEGLTIAALKTTGAIFSHYTLETLNLKSLSWEK